MKYNGQFGECCVQGMEIAMEKYKLTFDIYIIKMFNGNSVIDTSNDIINTNKQLNRMQNIMISLFFLLSLTKFYLVIALMITGYITLKATFLQCHKKGIENMAALSKQKAEKPTMVAHSPKYICLHCLGYLRKN